MPLGIVEFYQRKSVSGPKNLALAITKDYATRNPTYKTSVTRKHNLGIVGMCFTGRI